MAKILGLDVGISSVGFAVMDTAQQKILAANSHVFDAAEIPKTGESLAKPRRTARLTRRRLRRRARRKVQIKRLLQQSGLPSTIIDTPIISGKGEIQNTPWRLRADGLRRALSDDELARALFHIGKWRGFQSNAKSAGDNDAEGKKMITGMRELEEAMIRAGAQTIGDYLARQEKQRNNPGDYSHTIRRELLCEEIKILCRQQRKLGQAKASETLEQKLIEILKTQAEPQNVEFMVGSCPFEAGEIRAPKHSYSAELFILLSKLNNIKIQSDYGEVYEFTENDRAKIIAKCHAVQKLDFYQLRQLLDLSAEFKFNFVRYNRPAAKKKRSKKDDAAEAEIILSAEEQQKDDEKKTKFAELSGWREITAIIDPDHKTDFWADMAARAKINTIARHLSFEKSELRLTEKLLEMGLTSAQVESLIKNCNFSKAIGLSVKACDKLIPLLQQGLRYDEASAELGYSQKISGQKQKFLPPFPPIPNPVVNRALSQCRKVINAVIREHGMPDKIHIELLRDLGKPFDERKKIEKEIAANKEANEDNIQKAKEILGTEKPSGEDVMKLRLHAEQGGICAYSGASIPAIMLRDATATQIDHILPLSRSNDDSKLNKVLVLTKANQEKGNKTPFEKWGDTDRWPLIEAMAQKLHPKKAKRLLLKNFAEVEGDWKARHLNDSRYIARELKNFLEQNLAIGDDSKRNIQVRNGSITAFLRKVWGLSKSRDDDRHHALDAMVLAACDEGMVQKVTAWNKYQARAEGKEPHAPKPWPDFRDDVLEVMDKIFVSRLPHRGITGEGHKAEIKSLRKNAQGEQIIIERINLEDLTEKNLEKIVDRHRNQDLYDLLKSRLEAHGYDTKKAFAAPVHRPRQDGTDGPLVRGIRVYADDKSGAFVRGGFAKNGAQIRVDVFQKKGKFYLVPIYAWQVAQGIMPNQIATGGERMENWDRLDEHQFLFSLQKNDYVEITKSSGEVIGGYYITCDIANAQISLLSHDGAKLYKSLGVNTLKVFAKYTVDYFGRKHLVKREKRRGLAMRVGAKSGAINPGAKPING